MVTPIQIVSSGAAFQRGGAVVETAGGDKFAVLYINGALRVYSDLDGTPTEEDSDTPATIHGTGATITMIDAALDGGSPELIHIVSCANAVQDRDVAYATFNTSTGALSAWEEVQPYTIAPQFPSCTIAVDSNSKPRVAYTDRTTVGGSSCDNVWYTDKTGASWSTPEQVGDRSDKNDAYTWARITMAASNDVIVMSRWHDNSAGTYHIVYNRRNGSFGSEVDVFDSGGGDGVMPQSVTITTGETVYCYSRYSLKAREDSTEIDYGLNGQSGSWPEVICFFPGVLSPEDGATRIIFWSDALFDNLNVYINYGSGWSTEYGIDDSISYFYHIPQWSYYHNNQSGHINLLCQGAGGSAYYVEYTGPLSSTSSSSSSTTITSSSSSSSTTITSSSSSSSSSSTTITSSSSSSSTTITSSSSSSSTTITSSSSSSSSSISTPPLGPWAFGEENPTFGEIPVSWMTWNDGGAAHPDIVGDVHWGKLQLLSGEEGRSQTCDTGDAYTKVFTLTENRYGTGQGFATLQIRGSLGYFSPFAGEPPNWETYTVPITRTWRYVQVREIKA